ncbi:MAG: hypothetical protein HY046_02070 [Acidobacteria bacterium]|nr:hypothetical protein [Acidobacteriota bacterium]
MPARTSEPSPVQLEQVKENLHALLAAGAVDVREGGARMAEFEQFDFELMHRQHTILHFWSAERNLTRRVLRIVEQAPGRLVLEVERFGRPKPVQLEFVSKDAPTAEGRLSREKFRSRLEETLADSFGDFEVTSLSVARDLEHSFSERYPRGVMTSRINRTRRWAVLGVSREESGAAIDGALSAGLLWLDWTRQHTTGATVEGLRLILPSDNYSPTVRRLQGLGPLARIEVSALDEKRRRLEPVDLHDTGNLDSWIPQRRVVQTALESARQALEKIVTLAPVAIDLAVLPNSTEISVRFYGLEFGRWKDGRLFVELPEGSSRDSAATVIGHLREFRDPHLTDTNHPLYRVQPERWLESLALRDITRLDARLDSRHVYRQVPASAHADRGVIDLLSVTLDGRLAVIELKASEDIQLPLQGLDYWLRVRDCHASGALQAAGYFADIELQAAPPLLYLVAPGFRFHDSTDVLLRYFRPEIEVQRVGLNEQWRQGLRVVFRM